MSFAPFVKGKKLVLHAFRHGYAIGAFNTTNLEITRAIVDACKEEKAPIWVQTSEKAIAYGGLKNLSSIARNLCQEARIPAVLHLDHGHTLQHAKACLNAGYSSIMLDASSRPWKQNVKLTREAAQLAHRAGASAEGELGMLGREQRAYTEPSEALEFIRLTNVDYLAVAIGTQHGAFKLKAKEKIDLKRLREIHSTVSVPLVLHGASSVSKKTVKTANKFGAKLKGLRGIPENDLRKAIRCGIAKINIDTDLRLAFSTGLRQFLTENPQSYDIRECMSFATEHVKAEVKHKIELFGMKNKAKRL